MSTYMKFRKCANDKCGVVFDYSKKRCPKCGKKVKRGSFAARACGLVAVIVVIISVVLILHNDKPYPYDVNMPNLVNLSSKEEVEKRLKEDNLSKPNFKDIPWNKEKGAIVKQDPEAGSKVGKNQAITVYVSKGKVSVPELVGKSLEEAEKLIKTVNKEQESEFVLVPEYKYDSKPEGTILWQENVGEIKAGLTEIKVRCSQGSIEVPDLSGLSLEDAEKKLRELNLKYEKKIEDSDEAKGEIVRQVPEAGEKTEPNKTVTVYVSNGKIHIPDLHGSTKEEAQKKIDELNDKHGSSIKLEIKEKPDDGDKVDTIIGQSPAGDTYVDPDIESIKVTIVVPSQVKVPNLVGKTESQAKKMLADLSLKSRVSSVDQFENKGRVVSQSIGSNRSVKYGTTVGISVSSGYILVPDVRGKTGTEAKRILRDLGLVPSCVWDNVVTGNKSGDTDNAIVTGTDPAPGAKIESQGTNITIKCRP